MQTRRVRFGPLVAAAVIVTAVGLFTSLLPAGASTRADGATTTAAGGSGDDNRLFVVNAADGSLRGGTLKLTGVEPDVTSFTDRPERDVSTLATAKLASSWSKFGFAADPPNAALVTLENGRHVTTVVELGKPTVKGKTVTFRVKVLDPEKAAARLAGLKSETRADGPLHNPSLFIDDSGGTMAVRPITIAGNWGAGTSTVTIDGFTTSGGTAFSWTGLPATLNATANSFTLTTNEVAFGWVAGFGYLQADTVSGHADLAPGYHQLTICDSYTGNAPSQAAFPTPSASFSYPLTFTC